MSSPQDDLAVRSGHALSAVSWAAVLAGTVAALAMTITLDLLGSGFGFSLASPWLQTRASLAGFSPFAGAWSIAAGVVSLALGGYIAGRLRTHWHGVHADETHLRDTAHGLLVWALSLVVGMVLTALVLEPYLAAIAQGAAMASTTGPLSSTSLAAVAPDAERSAHIAAQASFFGAIGSLLGALAAAAAAALGGLQRDEATTHLMR